MIKWFRVGFQQTRSSSFDWLHCDSSILRGTLTLTRACESGVWCVGEEGRGGEGRGGEGRVGRGGEGRGGEWEEREGEGSGGEGRRFSESTTIFAPSLPTAKT